MIMPRLVSAPSWSSGLSLTRSYFPLGPAFALIQALGPPSAFPSLGHGQGGVGRELVSDPPSRASEVGPLGSAAPAPLLPWPLPGRRRLFSPERSGVGTGSVAAPAQGVAFRLETSRCAEPVFGSLLDSVRAWACSDVLSPRGPSGLWVRPCLFFLLIFGRFCFLLRKRQPPLPLAPRSVRNP